MNALGLRLYKKMYLIRAAEETIRKYYMEDEMKTPTHLSVGSEAIAAGVIGALRAQDQILGTYRSHGLYLAKTEETDKFFAELYGKATGAAKGKAGSMHMSAPESGLLGTSAVVGTTIPVAVGAAFANQYLKNDKIVAAFFGDGAVDEGVFWESLNLACLKKLPIIFVCEDNDLAIHAKAADRHGYRSITDIVSNFDCHALASNSTDVDEIFALAKRAVELIRQTSKPVFMHLKYYRYYEHVGINFDFQFGYRQESEYHQWRRRDPIDLYRKKLLSQGTAEQDIKNLEQTLHDQINKSVRLAKQAPFPKAEELLTDVFA